MERRKATDLDADAFVAWALDQPEGHFELDNGAVVAMAPERIAHVRANGRVWLALRTAIAARGVGCEALSDGAVVRVSDRTVYQPDALVRCGPPLPGEAIEVADPVVVVEVVSPSSRGVDRGVKLGGYFAVPSVRHYLIVDIDRALVIHHRRDDEGRIAVSIVPDGSLELDPPGLSIRVADLFAAP
jgi:Uma2 family endonuclease